MYWLVGSARSLHGVSGCSTTINAAVECFITTWWVLRVLPFALLHTRVKCFIISFIGISHESMGCTERLQVRQKEGN